MMKKQFFPQKGKYVKYYVQGLSFLLVCLFSLTSIAFASMDFPKDLTVNEAEAFSGDSNIDEAVLPESVVSIDEYAFSGCNSLSLVVIPDSVSFTHDTAFDNCPNAQFKVFKDTYAANWVQGKGEAFSYLDDEVFNQGDYTYSVCKGGALTIMKYRGNQFSELSDFSQSMMRFELQPEKALLG